MGQVVAGVELERQLGVFAGVLGSERRGLRCVNEDAGPVLIGDPSHDPPRGGQLNFVRQILARSADVHALGPVSEGRDDQLARALSRGDPNW